MLIETIMAGLLFITPTVQSNNTTDPFLLQEATCLAKNMYYEARNQGTAGRLAVSNVVLNRVKDKRFPNTVCEVVEQGPVRESWKKDGTMYPIRYKCQFSWFCDGKSDTPRNIEEYKELLNFSLTMLSNTYILVDITDGALFYHADYVKPSWAKTKHRTTEIGDHIFYTWDK
jgi:spore germination cell wall hydrolase CwlJ-like protein